MNDFTVSRIKELEQERVELLLKIAEQGGKLQDSEQRIKQLERIKIALKTMRSTPPPCQSTDFEIPRRFYLWW